MEVACGRGCLTFTLLLIGVLTSKSYGEERSGTLVHNFNISDYVVTLEFNLNNTELIVTGSKVYLKFNTFLGAKSGSDSVTAVSADSNAGNNPADDVKSIVIQLQVAHPDIARITNGSFFTLDPKSINSSQTHVLEVEGVFLGRTVLQLSYGYVGQGHVINMTGHHSQGGLVLERDEFFKVHLSVIRKDRVIDKIFIGVVALLVFLANIGMGCKVDLTVVKEVLKKPFAPAIGLFCQYLLMPLLAFAFTEMLKLEGGQALGFFATGCSPGGGASNIYTYLLAGDISLSITMTLISTIGSLGFIPLWLFTLGRIILNQYHVDIKIPYSNIVISLILLLIPVGVGVLIQRKRPEWAKKVTKFIRPIAVVFIIFMVTFGVYTNLYMFKLFTPMMILAGALLPYAGFLLGGVIAFILKQPWVRVKTIAIETGIQNTGIPIILMKFSLPQPDADLSIISPVAVATFTPIPLLIAVIYYEVRKRCCKDKKRLNMIVDDEEEDHEMPNGFETGDDNARLHAKEMKTIAENGK